MTGAPGVGPASATILANFPDEKKTVKARPSATSSWVGVARRMRRILDSSRVVNW